MGAAGKAGRRGVLVDTWRRPNAACARSGPVQNAPQLRITPLARFIHQIANPAKFIGAEVNSIRQ